MSTPTEVAAAPGLRNNKPKAFLSVGHDEYWSGDQRANVEAARDAGVNLAFFSGNEVFWKTRWENSIDGSSTPYRTLVTYKETQANAVIDPQTPTWTGTWRDPRFSPPADGGRPENRLTGTIFKVNAGTVNLQVPAADGKMRFWRGTTVATQAAGATATLGTGTVGYEWDEDADNGFRPPGLIRLSTTAATGVQVLQDYGSTYGTGNATHSLTLYRAPSGALVFGGGTTQWSWGLDSNHDRGSGAASVPMKQATVNLFADMGAQPATLQTGLVAATAVHRHHRPDHHDRRADRRVDRPVGRRHHGVRHRHRHRRRSRRRGGGVHRRRDQLAPGDRPRHLDLQLDARRRRRRDDHGQGQRRQRQSRCRRRPSRSPWRPAPARAASGVPARPRRSPQTPTAAPTRSA